MTKSNKYVEKNMYGGFLTTVEENAISLEDEYFVRLTSEALMNISKCQKETDSPTSYYTKWEKKIGEVIFVYNHYPFWGNSKFLVFDKFSADEIEKEKLYLYDLRIAEKDSLTRSAARQFANYLDGGKGDIEKSAVESAVALMLYLRNGYKKKDFWKAFRNELNKGIDELLAGKDTLETEEQLLDSPFPYKERINHPMDFIREANESNYNFDKFVLVDDDVLPIIMASKRYFEEEAKESLGQYAIFQGQRFNRSLKKEELIDFPAHELFFYSLHTSAYAAALYVMELITCSYIYFENIPRALSMGLAIYRKNGLTDADFWRNCCRELRKIADRDNR